jgi:hypothetical protein
LIHLIGSDGVKIVDPLGDMLVQEWEAAASQLANADGQAAVDVLNALGAENGADASVKPLVCLVSTCLLQSSFQY